MSETTYSTTSWRNATAALGLSAIGNRIRPQRSRRAKHSVVAVCCFVAGVISAPGAVAGQASTLDAVADVAAQWTNTKTPEAAAAQRAALVAAAQSACGKRIAAACFVTDALADAPPTISLGRACRGGLVSACTALGLQARFYPSDNTAFIRGQSHLSTACAQGSALACRYRSGSASASGSADRSNDEASAPDPSLKRLLSVMCARDVRDACVLRGMIETSAAALAASARACSLGDNMSCTLAVLAAPPLAFTPQERQQQLRAACTKGGAFACTQASYAVLDEDAPDAVDRARALWTQACSLFEQDACHALAVDDIARGQVLAGRERFERSCMSGVPAACAATLTFSKAGRPEHAYFLPRACRLGVTSACPLAAQQAADGKRHASAEALAGAGCAAGDLVSCAVLADALGRRKAFKEAFVVAEQACSKMSGRGCQQANAWRSHAPDPTRASDSLTWLEKACKGGAPIAPGSCTAWANALLAAHPPSSPQPLDKKTGQQLGTVLERRVNQAERTRFMLCHAEQGEDCPLLSGRNVNKPPPPPSAIADLRDAFASQDKEATELGPLVCALQIGASCEKYGRYLLSAYGPRARHAEGLKHLETRCAHKYGMEACARIARFHTRVAEPRNNRAAVTFGVKGCLRSQTGGSAGCSALAELTAPDGAAPNTDVYIEVLQKKLCTLRNMQKPYCRALGLAYAEGRGVERDAAQAAAWALVGCEGDFSTECSDEVAAISTLREVAPDVAKIALTAAKTACINSADADACDTALVWLPRFSSQDQEGRASVRLDINTRRCALKTLEACRAVVEQAAPAVKDKKRRRNRYQEKHALMRAKEVLCAAGEKQYCPKQK